MRSAPHKLFRIWDVIVLVLILLLVALTIYFAVSPEKGDAAEIYLDGKKYMTLPLSKDTEITLDHLTIVVSKGKVWVKDADCPDKICEKKGEIYKKGQSIVCLPNRIVIKIAGKGEVEAIT
ncbi:MAG TPA: NusG domain II-containing protein [Clostridiales bacterium]|nr:NusG domain II-containing protein [Clostridiales bacterium]